MLRNALFGSYASHLQSFAPRRPFRLLRRPQFGAYAQPFAGDMPHGRPLHLDALYDCMSTEM